MKYTDFEEIKNKIILQYWGQLKGNAESLGYSEAVSIREGRLKYIYYVYEANRKKIRKLYMKNDNNPMDRHKIAANFMFSILKVKPIRINRSIPKLPLQVFLANEYLAFYTALNIVELYVRDILGDDYGDYLLTMPKTYITDETYMYIQNTCKALFYLKHSRICDIFSYANILFMLESYTDLERKTPIELKTEQ